MFYTYTIYRQLFRKLNNIGKVQDTGKNQSNYNNIRNIIKNI